MTVFWFTLDGDGRAGCMLKSLGKARDVAERHYFEHDDPGIALEHEGCEPTDG